MSNHTPGPWEIDRSHGITIGTERYRNFCRVLMPSITRASEFARVEATAHLIAAAPDMLAMLKAVRAYHNGGKMYDMSAIDAVIAKAEGKGV